MIDAHIRIINVIEHLKLRVGRETSQGQAAGAAGQDKAGMGFVGGRETGLAISKNDFELAGIDDCATRECPLSQVRIVVG